MQANDPLRRALLTPQGRRLLADKEFAWFCTIYFKHYMKLDSADFHADLIATLQDWSQPYVDVLGFRGGAKSSYITTMFVLWASLTQRVHFPVIFGDTSTQAILNIAAIRTELETNTLLVMDYGDQSFGVKKSKEWNKTNLLLSCGVRIMGRSRGQRIRGFRHGVHRPDLLVLDDVEARESVRSKEYRDKTERWLRGDVIPSIVVEGGRLIITGNLLHTDSLMARLARDPLFHHKRYALIDANGKCTWKAMYPNQAALDLQEQRVGTIAFQREYMLKIIPEEGQPILPEWIQYYDKIGDVSRAGVGVDLAISQKKTADSTAMVSGVASPTGAREARIFVLPFPINEKLTFNDTLQQMKSIMLGMRGMYSPMFFIEDVGYQKAAIQEAERAMIPVKAVSPGGQDKRARLLTVATYIQSGLVRFPRRGCEVLLQQLLGFGIEDHDDLVDAFIYMVMGLVDQGLEMPDVIVL